MASVYWPGILAAQQQEAHVQLRPMVLGRWLCSRWGGSFPWKELAIEVGMHGQVKLTLALSWFRMGHRSICWEFS